MQNTEVTSTLTRFVFHSALIPSSWGRLYASCCGRTLSFIIATAQRVKHATQSRISDQRPLHVSFSNFGTIPSQCSSTDDPRCSQSISHSMVPEACRAPAVANKEDKCQQTKINPRLQVVISLSSLFLRFSCTRPSWNLRLFPGGLAGRGGQRSPVNPVAAAALR